MTLITPISCSICGFSPRCDTLPTRLTLSRRKNALALLPIATTSTSTPLSCHSRISIEQLAEQVRIQRRRKAAVGRHDDIADALDLLALDQERMPVLGVACATWPMTCFIARAYGREAFISSCALRIFDAETISSARVTLRVFCTLLILVLISLAPAIGSRSLRSLEGIRGSGLTIVRAGSNTRRACALSESRNSNLLTGFSPASRLLELFDALLERAPRCRCSSRPCRSIRFIQSRVGVREMRVQRLLRTAGSCAIGRSSR